MNSLIGSTESERLIKLVQNPISNIHKKNHFIKNDKTNQTNLPNVVLYCYLAGFFEHHMTSRNNKSLSFLTKFPVF